MLSQGCYFLQLIFLKVLFSAPSFQEENLDHENRSSRTDTPLRSPMDPNARRTGPGAGKQTMKESVKRRLDVRSRVFIFFLTSPPPPFIWIILSVQSFLVEVIFSKKISKSWKSLQIDIEILYCFSVDHLKSFPIPDVPGSSPCKLRAKVNRRSRFTQKMLKNHLRARDWI